MRRLVDSSQATLLIERSNTRELVGTACLYRGRPNLAVYPDLIIRARVERQRSCLNMLSSFLKLHEVCRYVRAEERRALAEHAQNLTSGLSKISRSRFRHSKCKLRLSQKCRARA